MLSGFVSKCGFIAVLAAGMVVLGCGARADIKFAASVGVRLATGPRSFARRIFYATANGTTIHIGFTVVP